ncbi:MAG: alpha-L-fucosidase, partial [Bacteroidales bacterium]|nr:alpha-L-fucosidase [Bacteroidales bacterium]
EWDRPSSDWKSEEFLAWLYNESPVRETVVVNDRWGSETRGRHGGIFTTEYGLVHSGEGLETTGNHPWEECRGIGTSFGFNRTENLDSYSSAEELIRILISTVAAGGNLLLDIGPAADGTIPVIMQQRLMEIGKWLGVNGEAIYDTRPYITDKSQESINPGVNKNIFFTKKGADLYVILLNWPEGDVIFRGIRAKPSAKASLLGSSGAVRMRNPGGSLTITLPRLTPDDYQLAYVIKISNL